jgi:hypothetical protein
MALALSKIMKLAMLALVCVLIMISCTQDTNESATTDQSTVVDQDIVGRVTQYGLYDVLRSGPLVDKPDTNTGKTHSASTIQHIKRTDQIPISKGVYFGFKTRIEPLPGKAFIKLKKVVRHPEMVLPDGSTSRGYQVNETKKVSSAVAFTTSGYSLDEDYEMVAGDWVFQYWYEDKLVVEQRFQTFHQQTSPEL